jgi:hypothetical protein
MNETDEKAFQKKKILDLIWFKKISVPRFRVTSLVIYILQKTR